MKSKLTLILACLIFWMQGVYAQDIIIKNAGDKIPAKITELSAEYVKYKKYERLGGPVYSVPSSDVSVIEYENGAKDIFQKDPLTNKVQIKHIAPENKEKTLSGVTENENGKTKAGQNNGVFEMIDFDGKTARFKAVVETPIYMVSLVSSDRTVNAERISNTHGTMRTAGGTIFTEGSSPIFADVKNILLPEGTEAKCEFGNLPVGFVPKSVTFLTAEKSDRMTYELAAGRWIKPKVIGAGDKINENDIVELIENNIIEAEISGEDITYVNLRIRRLVTNPVDVRIPVGSFFVSANPAAQNMVATAEKTTRLTTDAWQNIRIPAACANRPKDIPDSNDKFSVQRSPNQEELARLMPALNKSGAGTTTKQAAVWIITDNADYGDLGILVSDPGNVRAIGAVETARAMKICSEAGIDITAKSIWRDRETIISQLQAGELKTWLKKLSEEQTPKVTPVPQTATAKKTFPLKVKYADNDKIIPNTDIYLLYYDEQTSAIVDKIANTGSGNIVEFRIPQNEDGSTYSFVVLLSKTDADKAKTANNRRMIRIPPGENCTQLQLNIMQNGGMGNEGCAIQMTYK